jgi:glutamyl-tRNA synthetase
MLAWLHARIQGGDFILRIEDLDLPRVVAGSADQILRDLEWLGLDWDGSVVYQSDRNELYQYALDQLAAQGLTYECLCSRKDIQSAASAPHGKVGVYPGTCRQNRPMGSVPADEKKPSIRVQVSDSMSSEVGDFVVKRADSLFAYQLAVTVDDLDQGVTEVVRGEDLLDSTVKQIYLAQLFRSNMAYSESALIQYLHAPLMLDDKGQRMSKRDGSASVNLWRQNGGDAESMLGYLAFTSGLTVENRAISKQELLDQLSQASKLRQRSSLY